jgi:hypothetical protein
MRIANRTRDAPVSAQMRRETYAAPQWAEQAWHLANKGGTTSLSSSFAGGKAHDIFRVRVMMDHDVDAGEGAKI